MVFQMMLNGFSLQKKKVLNPNSYAIIAAENQWGIQTDRYLQVGSLELFGTLTWNLGASGTFPRNPQLGTFRNLTFAWNPLLEPSLGTLTWNLRTSWNLETLEPAGSLTWNLGTFRILYLEPLLGTSEPCGMTAPGLSLAETPKLSAVG